MRMLPAEGEQGDPRLLDADLVRIPASFHDVFSAIFFVIFVHFVDGFAV